MSDTENGRFYAELWPHSAALLRTAEVLCRDRQMAEDLVQETLLKGYRSIDALRPGTNAKAWLTTILRNTHIDRVRQRAGKTAISLEALDIELPQAPSEDASVDLERDALIEQFGDEQLIAALRALPPEICWSVLLVDVEGLTYVEAAEILDAPVGTAKSRVFRGRALLRDAISLNASPVRQRSGRG